MSLLSDLNNKIKALSTRMGEEVKSLWSGVNTAQTTAATAQSTATAAQTTANTANSTANTAKSTADTANSTANGAHTLANTANNTANNALAWSWQLRGMNVITSTASDTTTYWGNAKPGLYWFHQNGCLINQPSQYGILLNLTLGGGTEVAQIWKSQAGGNLYIRGGNNTGWANAWTPVSFDINERLSFRNGTQLWIA